MLLSSAKVEVKCYWLSDCIRFLTVPLVINICSVSSSHILEAEMPQFFLIPVRTVSMVMQFMYHIMTMYKWQICWCISQSSGGYWW